MIVLDTTVLVYSVGVEHPLRAPGRRMIEAAAEGRLRLTTTPEVIQEFAHVRARRRPRENAATLARRMIDLFSPLVVVDADVLRRGLGIYEHQDELESFDAVLAAVALEHGAEALVSADEAFAKVPRLPYVPLADIDRLFA